jgi:exodeoxyribonuclease-5
MAIDRIDRLDDGRLLILDYKTGSEVNAKGWAGSRLTEPQLPIYAAHAAEMAGEISGAGVAGVALAKVRLDDCAMVGVAAEDGLLPGVAGIADKKAHKLFADVADWPALLAQWRANVAAIAREVGAGEAAARFANEKDLEWCEVKPLLRLAERKAQMGLQALSERDDG